MSNVWQQGIPVPALTAMRTIVEKWVHPDYWPHPADPEALDRVEARFETYLPRCFRQCLEQVGPPSPGVGASFSYRRSTTQCA